MIYTLEGKRILSDAVEEKRFEINAATVSEAMRKALMEAIAQEGFVREKERLREDYRFRLIAETEKGQKLILTVNGIGHRWSDALEEAYVRICGWQGQEPDMPERPERESMPEQSDKACVRAIGNAHTGKRSRKGLQS